MVLHSWLSLFLFFISVSLSCSCMSASSSFDWSSCSGYIGDWSFFSSKSLSYYEKLNFLSISSGSSNAKLSNLSFKSVKSSPSSFFESSLLLDYSGLAISNFILSEKSWLFYIWSFCISIFFSLSKSKLNFGEDCGLEPSYGVIYSSVEIYDLDFLLVRARNLLSSFSIIGDKPPPLIFGLLETGSPDYWFSNLRLPLNVLKKFSFSLFIDSF